MVSYFDLTAWYKTVFALQQHHGYQLTSIEEWLPYERDIYVSMLIQFMKEEAERAKKQQ